MPDWEQLVTERLGHIKLPPEERREVIAEIAAHLDECYQALCDTGSPDPEGYTLAQVSDWKAFRRRIQKSKEDPMSLSRKVVMPGLAALFVAQVSLSLILHTLVALHGSPMEGQFNGGETRGVFYLPWLLTLPLASAVGAWLARRAGARPGQRLTAALFPALFAVFVSTVFGIVALLVSPEKLISEFSLAHQSKVLLFWVIVPAIACGLGAVPFLAGAPRQTEPAPPSDAARA